MRYALLFSMLAACGGGPGPGRCDSPSVWYPDADADGVGETTGSYFGCNPPAGWVDTLSAPEDTGADTSDTGSLTQSR